MGPVCSGEDRGHSEEGLRSPPAMALLWVAGEADGASGKNHIRTSGEVLKTIERDQWNHGVNQVGKAL